MSFKKLPSRGGDVIGEKNGSKSDIPEQLIKSITQRYDVETAFKLVLANKGLERMEGLRRCINLVHLDLSHNAITRMEGLDELTQLRRLELRCNKISRVEGVGGLASLQTLWLQGNCIGSLADAGLPLLAGLPRLQDLRLQDFDLGQSNPVCRLEGYKRGVVAALPALACLDGERRPAVSGYMDAAAAVQQIADAAAAGPAAGGGGEVELERGQEQQQQQAAAAAARLPPLPDVDRWLDESRLCVAELPAEGGGLGPALEDQATAVAQKLGGGCRQALGELREVVATAAGDVRDVGAAALRAAAEQLALQPQAAQQQQQAAAEGSYLQ